MPYIKISDPNIIDLAAWQQVINVVNQHSDSITAITNNFGSQAAGVSDWNSANDIVHEFDPGSQKILYGKTKIDPTVGSVNDDHMLFLEIDMTPESSGASAFSAKPVITATATFGSTLNPPTANNLRESVICTISAVSEDKFIVRVVNSRSTLTKPVPLFTGSNQFFYISWMAIGPK